MKTADELDAEMDAWKVNPRLCFFLLYVVRIADSRTCTQAGGATPAATAAPVAATASTAAAASPAAAAAEGGKGRRGRGRGGKVDPGAKVPKTAEDMDAEMDSYWSAKVRFSTPALVRVRLYSRKSGAWSACGCRNTRRAFTSRQTGAAQTNGAAAEPSEPAAAEAAAEGAAEEAAESAVEAAVEAAAE
jgi:hypothetical protein